MRPQGHRQVDPVAHLRFQARLDEIEARRLRDDWAAMQRIRDDDKETGRVVPGNHPAQRKKKPAMPQIVPSKSLARNAPLPYAKHPKLPGYLR